MITKRTVNLVSFKASQIFLKELDKASPSDSLLLTLSGSLKKKITINKLINITSAA